MTTMQTMDTAPRDGTTFLAFGVRRGDWGYTPDEETYTFGKWFSEGFSGKGSFVEDCVTPRYSNGFTFKYWAPLPDLPDERKERKP